jgi:hypothetical protein
MIGIPFLNEQTFCYQCRIKTVDLQLPVREVWILRIKQVVSIKPEYVGRNRTEWRRCCGRSARKFQGDEVAGSHQRQHEIVGVVGLNI